MFYPDIPNIDTVTDSLKLIQRQLADDPSVLHREECPYPPEFVELVMTTLHSKKVDDNTETFDDDGEIDIETESTELFRAMKRFKSDLSMSDVNERASMFRTLTSLLEKLINVKERSSALKNFDKFQTAIFDTIDQYLTAQQRTEFLDRIKELEL